MTTPICGCCGATDCLKCHPDKQPPYALQVDLGGPYHCNSGGSPGYKCEFTNGGVYVLTPTLNDGSRCGWGYSKQVCTPPDGLIGTLVIALEIWGVGASAIGRVTYFYDGNIHRGVFVGTQPTDDCIAMFAAGLTLTKTYSGSGLDTTLETGFCLPIWPTTLTFHS